MELKRSFGTPFIMAKSLLIVPYGIETRIGVASGRRIVLLIVPYGIETRRHTTILEKSWVTFNCTLWN